MANDTVWNYVNDFLAGRINRKQFWVLAEFKYPTHQISFHTLSALDCLTFVKSEVVYDREGSALALSKAEEFHWDEILFLRMRTN